MKIVETQATPQKLFPSYEKRKKKPSHGAYMHYYKLTNICACLSLFWSLMWAAWLHLSMFHLLSALYTEINRETSAEEENVSISWSAGMHLDSPRFNTCTRFNIWQQWVKQEPRSPLLYNNIPPTIFYIFITVSTSHWPSPTHYFPSSRSHCWGVGVDTLHYPLNCRLCEHEAWCILCLDLCT